jgi:hypothetical protein
MTTEEIVMTDVTGGLLPRDDLADVLATPSAKVSSGYAADRVLSLLRSPEVVERAARTLAEHRGLPSAASYARIVCCFETRSEVEHRRHVAEVLLGAAGGAPEPEPCPHARFQGERCDGCGDNNYYDLLIEGWEPPDQQGPDEAGGARPTEPRCRCSSPALCPVHAVGRRSR